MGQGDDSEPPCVVGLCQLEVGADKAKNIAAARAAIAEAVQKGANLVLLPECWNSPYGTKHFAAYAEPMPSVGGEVSAECVSARALVEAAREHKLWLCGGTFPESHDGKLYNTCLVFNPEGEVVAKHRKMHLFDIDIPGEQTFKESDVLTAGDAATVFETPWGHIGVGICYDIRFPEYSIVLRQKGCKLLLFPAAFNMATGPRHWELLQRARAVDNQCYVITASPSRVPGAEYQAYGHSMVVDPWGQVGIEAGHEPAVLVHPIDWQSLHKFRKNVPSWNQKRLDLYQVNSQL